MRLTHLKDMSDEAVAFMLQHAAVATLTPLQWSILLPKDPGNVI